MLKHTHGASAAVVAAVAVVAAQWAAARTSSSGWEGSGFPASARSSRARIRNGSPDRALASLEGGGA
jgi:hypothetical protein